MDSSVVRRCSSKEEALQITEFQLPWALAILNSPTVEVIPDKPRAKTPDEDMSDSMFNGTLSHATGIMRRVQFRRPCLESDAASRWEYCYMMSIGAGVDGMPGRAHGGFISLVIDHLTGTCAYRESGPGDPPATATLTVDYKAPIMTPGVVLARAWVVEIAGRKVWVRGTLEDGQGKVYGIGKTLFIAPRKSATSL